MRIEFAVHEDWADLLTEAIREHLKDRGYQDAMHLKQIQSDSIYQFRDGDTFITLEEQKTSDDTRLIVLSCESPDVDIEGLLIGSFSLFSEAMYGILMNALPTKEGKLNFSAWLRKAIQKAEDRLKKQ